MPITTINPNIDDKKHPNLQPIETTEENLLEIFKGFNKEEFVDYLVANKFVSQEKITHLRKDKTEEEIIQQIYKEAKKVGGLEKKFNKLVNSYLLQKEYEEFVQILLILGIPKNMINKNFINVFRPIVLIYKYEILQQGTSLVNILREKNYNILEIKPIIRQAIDDREIRIDGLNAPEKDKKILEEFLLD